MSRAKSDDDEAAKTYSEVGYDSNEVAELTSLPVLSAGWPQSSSNRGGRTQQRRTFGATVGTRLGWLLPRSRDTVGDCSPRGPIRGWMNVVLQILAEHAKSCDHWRGAQRELPEGGDNDSVPPGHSEGNWLVPFVNYQIMEMCFKKNPNRRPSFKQILSLLKQERSGDTTSGGSSSGSAVPIYGKENSARCVTNSEQKMVGDRPTLLPTTLPKTHRAPRR